MKTKALFITIVTLILTTGILLAEETTAKELSNTRCAAIEIRITTDPKVLPIITHDQENNQYLMTQLMLGNQLPDRISNDLFGQAGRWQDFFEIREVGFPREVGGMHALRMELGVSLDKTYKPAAKEFLEIYLQKLQEQLKSESELGLTIYQQKHQACRMRVSEATAILDNLLQRQNALDNGQGALDKESVRHRIYDHQQKIIENDIQQAMLKKRAEQLIKQISQANMEKEQADAIDTEIDKLNGTREKFARNYMELDNARNRLAAVLDDPQIKKTEDDKMKTRRDETMNKINDVKSSIDAIEDQISKLTAHKRQLRGTAADAIQELNRQLREVTIRQEELELEATVLHGYSPGSLSDSRQYELLEVQIQAARENLHRAIVEADAFKA